MPQAHRYTLPDKHYACTVEDYGYQPGNSCYDDLPPLPWPNQWPHYIDGNGVRKDVKKNIVEKKLAFNHLFRVMRPDQPVDTVTAKDALAVLRKVALHTSGNAANKDRKNHAAAWEWGRKYYAPPAQSVLHSRKISCRPAPTS
ncbi:hypothetical protein [uncultured Desulfovibrio sp.]|uniref:hypothetical protein n=1 Tax=uncultured Desulfovibrio sp. TaxID=167968 RepID=UPI002636BFAF|nr:hypothetical protein [uncultured Desulfovibrio sp.]